jgi:hypothetical protein
MLINIVDANNTLVSSLPTEEGLGVGLSFKWFFKYF